MDGLAGLDILTENLHDGLGGVYASGDERIHASLEVGECFSYGCVEHYHGSGTVGL